MTRTGRSAQIEALAQWLYDQEELGFPATEADIARENTRGWTLETPAPMGHTMRHEGVGFTADEIAQAQARVVALRHYVEEHS